MAALDTAAALIRALLLEDRVDPSRQHQILGALQARASTDEEKEALTWLSEAGGNYQTAADLARRGITSGERVE